jgi:enoyl-CoA hydratase/carnithine racemase
MREDGSMRHLCAEVRLEAIPMHISVETLDRIAIVKLDRAVTNAIDKKMVADLSGAIKTLEEDDGIHGVVLTGANDKFFSIGLDIPMLFEFQEREFKSFYHSFNQLCSQLLRFPKPMVAAIGGHAIAGGYILTLCCDYRLIAEGRKLIGLNEIKLGLPVPYIADCMLRTLIGFGKARQVMDSGAFYEPYDARTMGMVDEIYPAEDLLDRAVKCVAQLAQNDLRAFGAIKLNRLEPVLADIESRVDTQEALFVEMWFSEKTRERLVEAKEKF